MSSNGISLQKQQRQSIGRLFDSSETVGAEVELAEQIG